MPTLTPRTTIFNLFPAPNPATTYQHLKVNRKAHAATSWFNFGDVVTHIEKPLFDTIPFPFSIVPNNIMQTNWIGIKYASNDIKFDLCYKIQFTEVNIYFICGRKEEGAMDHWIRKGMHEITFLWCIKGLNDGYRLGHPKWGYRVEVVFCWSRVLWA